MTTILHLLYTAIRVRFLSRKTSTVFAHALWTIVIRLRGPMEAVVRRAHL